MGIVIDCTGVKINRLTAISRVEGRRNTWNVRCDCGKEFETEGTAFRKGETYQCRYCANKSNSLNKREDLAGKVFGSWTILRFNSSNDGALWECKCECGDVHLKTGNYVKRYKRCIKCRYKQENDMVGKKYGDWTVLKAAVKMQGKQSTFLFWECQCKCGNIQTVGGYALRANKSSSCRNCFNRIEYGEAAFNKLYGTYRVNAKNRGIEWGLTKDQFRTLTQENCFYTGLPPSSVIRRQGGNYVYNGVDRMDNDKGYSMDNCVSCNSKVNTMKMDLHYSDFIVLCNLITKTVGNKNQIQNELKIAN